MGLDLAKVAPSASEVLSLDSLSTAFPDTALAQLLAAQWIRMERQFTAAARSVFRALRAESDRGLAYFATTRRHFFRFLRRPNRARDDLLLAFQDHFNSVEADMRGDPAVKDELHYRCEQLSDQLWALVEHGKDESQRQLDVILADGWLAASLARIVALHANLLQLELQRYYATVGVARDFLCGLQRILVPEQNESVSAPVLPFSFSAGSDGDSDPAAARKLGKPAGKGAKSGSVPSASSKRSGLTSPPPVAKLDKRTSISKGAAAAGPAKKGSTKGAPAKRPSSADITEESEGASGEQPVGGDGAESIALLRQAVQWLEEQLFSPDDVVAVMRGRPVQNPSGSQPGTPRGAHRRLDARPTSTKARKAATQAASGKGAKPVVETPGPVGPITADDVAAMRQAALRDAQLKHMVETENEILMGRARRLLQHCVRTVVDLDTYAHTVFQQKLDNWLTMRVKGESNSINALIRVVRNAIEQETPLHFRLRLEDEDFFIDQDVLCHPLPSAPVWSPFESTAAAIALLQDARNTAPSALRVPDLLAFSPDNIAAFIAVASKHSVSPVQSASLSSSSSSSPSSLMPASELRALLLRGAKTLQRWLPNPSASPDGTAASTSNGEAIPSPAAFLPPVWVAADAGHVQRLVEPFVCESPLSADAEGVVDWREFALALALPAALSSPSLSQLSKLSASYSQAAEGGTRIALPAFHSVPLWFEHEASPAGSAVRDSLAAIFSAAAAGASGDGTATARDDAVDWQLLLCYLCFDDSDSTGAAKAQRLVADWTASGAQLSAPAQQLAARAGSDSVSFTRRKDLLQ